MKSCTKGLDQKDFEECLDRLANGKLTLQDWEYLKTRSLVEYNFSREEIKKSKAKSVKICALNRDTASHNRKELKLLQFLLLPA